MNHTIFTFKQVSFYKKIKVKKAFFITRNEKEILKYKGKSNSKFVIVNGKYRKTYNISFYYYFFFHINFIEECIEQVTH